MPLIGLGYAFGVVAVERIAYRNLLQDLSLRIEQVADISSRVLATPIWYVFEDEIRAGLETVVSGTDVVAAVARDVDDRILAWCLKSTAGPGSGVTDAGAEEAGSEVVCRTGEPWPESTDLEGLRIAAHEVVFEELGLTQVVGELEVYYATDSVWVLMKRRLTIDAGLFVLILVVLVGGVFWATKRAILEPLGELRQAIRGSRHGELRSADWASADELGEVIGEYNEVVSDTLDEKAALVAKLALYESSFESLRQGICVFDRDFRLAAFNRRYPELMGHEEGTIELGMSLSRLLRANAAQGEYGSANVEAVIIDRLAIAASGEPYRRERERPNGTILEVDSNPLPDGGFVTLYTDITKQKAHEAQMRLMTLQDPLTRLTNRALFLDRLRQSLAIADRTKSRLAVLLIDVDHFQEVNETYGLEVGDRVLEEVGSRLDQIVRKSDTAARLGDDEFAVIQHRLDHLDDAALLAHRILGRLTRTIEVGEHAFQLSASIGITIYPDDDLSSRNILRHAELALFAAKAEGRRRFRYFSPEVDKLVSERRELEEELFLGLKERQFVLYYQPRIDLGTTALMGAEAEVRWRHPKRGWMPPSDFLALAQERGLVVPLTEWMLEEACRQRLHWQHRLPGPWRVTVPLATRHFEEGDVVESVTTALDKTALPHHLLEVEVSEAALSRYPEVVSASLHSLHDLGVVIAVRDCHPGTSALSELKRFPLDTLKLCRDYVEGLENDLEAETVARVLIDLAHRLHLRVVAEGVDEPKQLAWMRTERCDEVQGEVFSRPVTGEEFTTWMVSRTVNGR